MDFGEAIPLPLDTADGFKVGRDDLTPPGGIGLRFEFQIPHLNRDTSQLNS